MQQPIVFTASIIICSRLLWAQYGKDVEDEVAVTHSRALLEKAETIFQNLDYDNSLVLNCAKFIRNLPGLHLSRG